MACQVTNGGLKWFQGCKAEACALCAHVPQLWPQCWLVLHQPPVGSLSHLFGQGCSAGQELICHKHSSGTQSITPPPYLCVVQQQSEEVCE